MIFLTGERGMRRPHYIFRFTGTLMCTNLRVDDEVPAVAELCEKGDTGGVKTCDLNRPSPLNGKIRQQGTAFRRVLIFVSGSSQIRVDFPRICSLEI